MLFFTHFALNKNICQNSSIFFIAKFMRYKEFEEGLISMEIKPYIDPNHLVEIICKKALLDLESEIKIYIWNITKY